ncbi:MAG TPA: hypothetical protein VE944_30765 [Nostoc sp.]|uniref:hypothetical protein n=1 Tax=Nostoc sp. TaxID=1180 RepID=UPI002D29D511|nr:hypothetical protein [Nostoc sp.]HYX18674.1 hypothetical protein [Nostoc sp.]
MASSRFNVKRSRHNNFLLQWIKHLLEGTVILNHYCRFAIHPNNLAHAYCACPVADGTDFLSHLPTFPASEAGMLNAFNYTRLADLSLSK